MSKKILFISAIVGLLISAQVIGGTELKTVTKASRYRATNYFLVFDNLSGVYRINTGSQLEAGIRATFPPASLSGSYTDLYNKPTSMTPTAHKSSHATGGSDALAPVDIGADVSGAASSAVASHVSTYNHPATTSNLPEGSNLYFTTDRASSAAPVQSVLGRTGAVAINYLDVPGAPLVCTNNGIYDGLDGSKITTASGAPLSYNGASGDIYINSATWDLYQKGNSSWSLIGNIKGAAGSSANLTHDNIVSAMNSPSNNPLVLSGTNNSGDHLLFLTNQRLNDYDPAENAVLTSLGYFGYSQSSNGSLYLYNSGTIYASAGNGGNTIWALNATNGLIINKTGTLTKAFNLSPSGVLTGYNTNGSVGFTWSAATSTFSANYSDGNAGMSWSPSTGAVFQ